MAAWQNENMGTILISLGLLAAIGLILRSMIRDRKAGKSSCGGNCAHCKGCH